MKKIFFILVFLLVSFGCWTEDKNSAVVIATSPTQATPTAVRYPAPTPEPEVLRPPRKAPAPTPEPEILKP